MAMIFVDAKPCQVSEGQNLLQACLSLGFNLPYFCWHPAMGSVGACRQCAVKQFKDENDTRGKLVMACMTPAADGTRVSIEDADAREFRASVTEWLMVNHPHDCPVCDEGGECHLQDMTVMTGHTYRRFRGQKRTFRNQYLGPLINHEMNRCIQCYRCVRFYRDYAGGRDLDAFVLGNQVFFGRSADGILENEFSGNLVEVCPTGVFTDKTLKRHYTRKWDLQTAPSICVHCGVGCNTIPGERYGVLRRVRNRYHGQVNGYFLCDRGRYGYEFVNSERRLRRSLIKENRNEKAEPATKDDALRHIGGLLRDRAGVIGIGSPRASLEANFALRAWVGAERFYLGMSETDCRLISLALKILRQGPARSPSLHDVESADAVFVLGEDVAETAPMLALALRQSARRRPMKLAEEMHIPLWNDAAVRELIQQQKGPLFIAAACGTRLDDVAAKTYRAAPDDLARLGFAVAHAINAQAPAVTDLSEAGRLLAEEIALALTEAERPLIVSGTSCGCDAILQAAANVAWALCEKGRRAAELSLIVPECNAMGLGLMGGGGLKEAFQTVQQRSAETVLILENDLYRRADAASVDAFLDSAKHVIAIDHLTNPTTLKAEVALPGASFAEGDGTLVNNEGRAQRFYQVFVPSGEIQESWRWLRDMMVSCGRSEAGAWRNLDDITAALARALPAFQSITDISPPAGFRLAGAKIPRQPHRQSGRTAVLAAVSVHEPRPPDDPDSALAFSMEGYEGQPPSSLISRFWAPGWNSIQALNKFQSEIGGPLHGGDPGRRLIEAAALEEIAYFDGVPGAFTSRPHEWFIAPIYHIFGSEELSLLATGISELAPRPYVGLSTEDAHRLGVDEGTAIELRLAEAVWRLPVKLIPTLPTGVAGLPAGLPGVAGIPALAWSQLVLPTRDGTAAEATS